jgi:hypothetical protein
MLTHWPPRFAGSSRSDRLITVRARPVDQNGRHLTVPLYPLQDRPAGNSTRYSFRTRRDASCATLAFNLRLARSRHRAKSGTRVPSQFRRLLEKRSWTERSDCEFGVFVGQTLENLIERLNS